MWHKWHYTHSCELAELRALHFPTPFPYPLSLPPPPSTVNTNVSATSYCYCCFVLAPSGDTNRHPFWHCQLALGQLCCTCHKPTPPSLAPMTLSADWRHILPFLIVALFARLAAASTAIDFISLHCTSFHLLLSLTHPLTCLPLPLPLLRLKLDNLWGCRAQEIFFLTLLSRF